MNFSVLVGDVVEVLPTLEAHSFDAVLCDPPYALTDVARTLQMAGRRRASGGFMGQGWDSEIPGIETWREALRVLKPGAMLLAFGGTRTHHRLMCALEDAGFEIRDTLCWLYGSGFPKSLDVSKAIDRAAGHRRGSDYSPNLRNAVFGKGMGGGTTTRTDPAIEPSAARWSGYGTALKPAWEPCIVAMKPLDGTFAANAQKWGVAGINVAGCRVATALPDRTHGDNTACTCRDRGDDQRTGTQSILRPAVAETRPASRNDPLSSASRHARGDQPHQDSLADCRTYRGSDDERVRLEAAADPTSPQLRLDVRGPRALDATSERSPSQSSKPCSHFIAPTGRWPSNVILSHTPDCREVGTRKVKSSAPSSGPTLTGPSTSVARGAFAGVAATPSYADPDGTETIAAYDCAPECPVRLLDEQSGERGGGYGTRGAEDNASSINMGGVNRPSYGQTVGYGDNGSASRFFYTAKVSTAEREGSDHPTMKPIDLTRYLAKLILPPQRETPRRLLVPFAGVGSEMIGAILAGWDEVVGIEKDEAYAAKARERIVGTAPLFLEEAAL